MREGRVNWVNDFLMQTKSMTSWAGTNNLVFVATTNAHNILRKQSQEVFNVQVALHFPNSLPTSVHRQTSRIIFCQSPLVRHPRTGWTALWV